MQHVGIPAPDHLSPKAKRTWNRLMRALDEREEDNGHAYCTPSDATFLKGWNLKQPGHTRYPYSMPNEDLSDEAQGVTP